MGKVKKIKHRKTDPLQRRPGSLVSDLSSGNVKSKFRSKERGHQQQASEFVDSQLSQKILKQARKQQEDLEEEVGISKSKRKRKQQPVIRLKEEVDNSDQDSDQDEADFEEEAKQYDYGIVDIDEDDAKVLEAFMSRDDDAKSQLADMLKERITENRTEIRTQFSDTTAVGQDPLPEPVRDLYSEMAPVLARYRSGKVPKGFKMIPNLKQWEQAVVLTQPDNWTAALMYQATRLFVSNMRPHMLQRFLSKYLLPRIRDDISEYKKLNFHLYQSIKKSMFKPGAFYKGIVLPLCRSGTCTLREAVIVSSALSHESVNMEHSAAAMCKISEMPYSGATSIMLRVLLEKRYNLPRRAVETVSRSFLRFIDEKRQLPVLWHQSLLSLVQRYKRDIEPEVRQAILTQLIHKHRHSTISALVRDELLSVDQQTTDMSVD